MLTPGAEALPWYVDIDPAPFHFVADDVAERVATRWLSVSIRFDPEPDPSRDTSCVLPRIVFPVTISRLATTIQSRTRDRRRLILYPASPSADPADSGGR